MAETIGGICIWSPMNVAAASFNWSSVNGGTGSGGCDFAVGIVAVGGLAELDGAFIDLVVGHHLFGELGAATEHDDEQTGGIGIERAAMADLFDAEPAADHVHHVVRSRAGGLVNQQRTVKRGKFLHVNYRLAANARRTAAITFRCTDSGLPEMRAPAAAGWPPPPNCAAISFTFTLSLLERRLMRVRSGFQFLKNARDHDRLNGADVVNQAFRVVAFRAGAGEVGLLQPEPRNVVAGGEAEFAVNVLEQPRAGKRIRLIDLLADLRQVGAARDQFRAGVKRAGPGRGVLERAGVRRDGGEQAIGHRPGDRPARDLEQAVNQLAGQEGSRAETQLMSA